MDKRWMLFAVTVLGATALAAISRAPQTPTPRPYPLGVCAVSGEELGAMGKPIVKVYDGREVRFCCKSCIKDFEADKAGYWAKIDEQIEAEQRMHYPLDTCIVSGDPLRREGKDSAAEFVHDNRLVRVCAEPCRDEFLKEADAFAAKLDAAIADAQREGYPLTTCPISAEELGSMGEPYELVYANRLVRLCCDGCLDKFHADPNQAMAVLDKAYADAQRPGYPLTECVVSGMELGSMGEPAELVAGTQLVRFCCDGCFRDFKADPGAYLPKLRDK